MADEYTIDPSEYEYSKEKYDDMLNELNITQAINEINEIESENDSVVEEEINQICVYIRNYDSDGNLIDNPKYAIKTCIDTFERSLLKINWTERVPIESDSGVISCDKVPKEELRETMNSASVLADEEILKVNPHIIQNTRFLNKFLEDYFNQFEISSNTENKTLYIEYHDISKDLLNYYEINLSNIIFFKSIGYTEIGLNLDNKSFIIDVDNLIELKSLSIENALIEVKSEAGLSLKADNFYLDNCVIKSKFDKLIATFSLTIKGYAKITYIDFSDDICKFDFLNASMDQVTKWMNSSVEIYGIYYTNMKKDLNYKLENIFNFTAFYNVNISSVNIGLDSINMTLFKFSNISNIRLSSINFIANTIKKNLISLTKVTSFIACGVYATQNNKESSRVYLFYTNNGNISGEYKFTSVISTNLGLIGSNNESVSEISFNSCRADNFSVPIRFVSPVVNKFIFSNCSFTNISELKLIAQKLSIFDSRFTNINSLILEVSNKFYLNNTYMTGDKLELAMTNDSITLLDNASLKFKESTISGESGTCTYKDKKSNLSGDSLKLLSLSKLGSSDSQYKFKDLEVASNNINSFNPTFINGSLKTVKMSGNITNTLLINDYNKSSKVSYNFTSAKGNISIYNNDYVSDMDIELNNSDIDINIDAAKDNSEINATIGILCGENATGSSIASYKTNMKFVPKTEGRFTDLEAFTDTRENLNDKKWKDRVAYGYLSDE